MKKLTILGLALLFSLSLSAQEKQWAVVDMSTCYLRVSPDYEAGLDSQVLMGVPVEVIGHERYWDQIIATEPHYKGWVTNRGLAYMTEAEKDAWIEAPKFICIAEYSHIFEQPSAAAERVCDFTMGNLVRRTGETRGRWVKVALPSGRTGWVPKADVADFAQWTAGRNATAQSLLAVARKLLGTPYLWGGMSIKGTDCSGLMRTAYFMNGILLPRDAREQVKTGDPVPVGDISAYQPGDLLFFGSKATAEKPMKVTHVGMYIGEGKIIHSSLKVRISSLLPEGDDYYSREPIAACRVLGNVDCGKGIISIAKCPYYFKQ